MMMLSVRLRQETDRRTEAGNTGLPLQTPRTVGSQGGRSGSATVLRHLPWAAEFVLNKVLKSANFAREGTREESKLGVGRPRGAWSANSPRINGIRPLLSCCLS